MATLTETSYLARKMAPVAVILVLVLLIFYFAFQLLFIYLKPTTTVVEVAVPVKVDIDVEFGKLPALRVKDASSSAGTKYVLDTINGKPLDATSAATVYFMPEVVSGFGYLNRIITMAKASNIDSNQIKERMSGRIATYSDGVRTLTINTKDFNFLYNFTITAENTKFSSKPEKEDLENFVIEYLRDMGRYPEELAQGKRNIIYMNYNPTDKSITIVTDVAQANMAEVDFHHPDLAGYPVVSSKYFNTNNFVVVAFDANKYKVVRAQIQHHERSKEQRGIYPVKSGADAYKEFVDGKGFVVSGKPPAGSEIRIKQMSMAYLDTEEYQQYMQPIFVLLGENNFVAYIPAIKNEYINN